MSVIDDGVGLRGKSVDNLAERVGIGNARARLMYLYGDQHSFSIESPPSGGFAVHMTIPFRTANGLRSANVERESVLQGASR